MFGYALDERIDTCVIILDLDQISATSGPSNALLLHSLPSQAKKNKERFPTAWRRSRPQAIVLTNQPSPLPMSHFSVPTLQFEAIQQNGREGVVHSTWKGLIAVWPCVFGKPPSYLRRKVKS